MSVINVIDFHHQTFRATCDDCRIRSAPWETESNATVADFLALIGWTRTPRQILCPACVPKEPAAYWLCQCDSPVGPPVETAPHVEEFGENGLAMAYFSARVYVPTLAVIRSRDFAQLVSFTPDGPPPVWRYADGTTGP